MNIHNTSALQVYSLLLALYPKSFRDRYAIEKRNTFDEQYTAAASNKLANFGFWSHVAADELRAAGREWYEVLLTPTNSASRYGFAIVCGISEPLATKILHTHHALPYIVAVWALTAVIIGISPRQRRWLTSALFGAFLSWTYWLILGNQALQNVNVASTSLFVLGSAIAGAAFSVTGTALGAGLKTGTAYLTNVGA